jgi:hypothetical protein
MKLAFENTQGARHRRALPGSASFSAKRLILVEYSQKNGLNKEIMPQQAIAAQP